MFKVLFVFHHVISTDLDTSHSEHCYQNNVDATSLPKGIYFLSIGLDSTHYKNHEGMKPVHHGPWVDSRIV
jgi:hypothetical protein